MPVRIVIAVLAAWLAAGAAAAETCGPLPDRAAERDALFEALAEAETPALGRIAADRVWRFWVEAPDDRAQALIDRIFERRAAYDHEAAQEAAEALVAYCPAYPEGWNQLATVLFLRGRFDASLDAIIETLEREPKHFGALSGRAQILIRQGRARLANEALREAVEIHPWMLDGAAIGPLPGEEL